MPRTALTVREVVLAGVTMGEVSVDAANGMSFSNIGNETIFYMRTAGTVITVTFRVPAKVKGLTITDVVVVMGATASLLIGPFPSEIFNQVDGTVYVDFSVATNGTCSAIHTAKL
jgi:hypothetical protein